MPSLIHKEKIMAQLWTVKMKWKVSAANIAVGASLFILLKANWPIWLVGAVMFAFCWDITNKIVGSLQSHHHFLTRLSITSCTLGWMISETTRQLFLNGTKSAKSLLPFAFAVVLTLLVHMFKPPTTKEET